VSALKDDLMPRYARMIYNGYWFSPERRLLQQLIDRLAAAVNGRVRVKLYKGTVLVSGRSSRDRCSNASIASFEDDQGAYNQADAARIHPVERAAHANRGQAGRNRRFLSLLAVHWHFGVGGAVRHPARRHEARPGCAARLCGHRLHGLAAPAGCSRIAHLGVEPHPAVRNFRRDLRRFSSATLPSSGAI